MEGAGVVEAVGEGVDSLAVGDRVAYAAPPVGSYAEERLMPAGKVVKIPAGIDSRQAAAMMLQGMTVEYLLRRTYPVRSGETILFHAAAGGVGLIACQWAKHLGATVIGTVGSDEKAALARSHGCDHTIVYTRENFTERVRELTGGAGVPVVYDAVGRDTFEGSLDCLAPRGMLVSFGQSSGKVDPFDVGVLSARGSLYLTRPTLMTYTASRADLEASAQALFDVVGRGRGARHREPDLPSGRSGGGAPGPRVAADDGLDGSHALIRWNRDRLSVHERPRRPARTGRGAVSCRGRGRDPEPLRGRLRPATRNPISEGSAHGRAEFPAKANHDDSGTPVCDASRIGKHGPHDDAHLVRDGFLQGAGER